MARPSKSPKPKKPAAPPGSVGRPGTGGLASSATRRDGSPTAAVLDGTMSTSQLVVWVCLHLLVIVVPIATSNVTWIPGARLPLTFDQFDIVKVFFQRGLALIGLGAWAWHILIEGGRLRRTKVDWLILGVLAWFTLTTFTSISPATAFFGKYRRFEGLLSFITYAVIFFLATQMIDRGSRVRSIARSLFFSGTFVSVYGLMQYVGFDPVRWGNLPFEANRSFSTYGNPDLLGGFLVFPLAVSVALAFSEENPVWRAVYWLGFGVTGLVWITAFTRGSWVGGTVALAVVGVCAVRQRSRLDALDWSIAGVFAAAAAAIVARSLRSPTAVMNVWARVLSIFDFNDPSARTRFEIWRAAVDAIKSRPVFGFGLDTFRLVFPRFKPIEYVKDAGYISVADNVHNYPLQLASAVGIPGFVLLYGLFVAVAVISAPLVFARQERPDRLVLAGFWAAAVGYLVSLSFGISVTGSSFLLWLSLAVMLSPTATTREVRPPSWGVVVAAVALVLVAVLSVGNVLYIVADNHYLQSRVKENGDRRIAEAEAAVKLNPFNDMYRAEVGLANVDMVVSYYTQASSAQSPEQRQALTAQALRYFGRAEASLLDTIEFVPWEYDNYVFLTNLYTLGAEIMRVRGDALGVEQMYDKAIAMGERGVEVERYGPAIRFQLSRALVEKGRLEDAREHMEFAVQMDPRYIDGRMLLSDIYQALGRYEDALEQLKAAQALIERTGGTRPGLEDAIRALEASVGTAPVR